MLTLEETLADQERLDAICADRPLRTSETFKPNAYYGIDRVLKTYAGVPRQYALKAVVPHGMHFSNWFVWEKERDAFLPMIFCDSLFSQQRYVDQTEKLIVPVAAPFLYVMELLKDQPRPERQGTLFFPAHSIEQVTVQMNFDRLADQLSSLESEYQPVTICIYWKDYLLGQHIPFQKRGMRVVSAGHRYDPRFLFRLYHLCSLHRYASSSNIGTHLFYSVKAGTSFFFIHEDHRYKIHSPSIIKNLGHMSAEVVTEIKKLFDNPQRTTTKEQREIVDFHLGSNFFRSRQDLRNLIFLAEALDKMCFVRHKRRMKPVPVLPYAFQRTIHAPYTFARRVASKVKYRLLHLQCTKHKEQ